MILTHIESLRVDGSFQQVCIFRDRRLSSLALIIHQVVGYLHKYAPGRTLSLKGHSHMDITAMEYMT
jgi:hypothetical protein